MLEGQGLGAKSEDARHSSLRFCSGLKFDKSLCTSRDGLQSSLHPTRRFMGLRPLIWVINLVVLPITLHITTHGPPSNWFIAHRDPSLRKTDCRLLESYRSRSDWRSCRSIILRCSKEGSTVYHTGSQYQKAASTYSIIQTLGQWKILA